MTSFSTTRWTLISEAADPRLREPALEHLCRIYRPAVLGWLRRRGLAPDAAEDQAQSFFVHLLEKELINAADPARGRFRAFLITALRNFHSHQLQAARALKRGGGLIEVALDDLPELASEQAAPDEAFDRDFARALLGRSIRLLQEEAEAAGRGALFASLREYLVETPDADEYERLAEQFGMRRNTLAVAVHRLRSRLQEIVRAELMDTVNDDASLELELRVLRHSLGSSGNRPDEIR